eukprot:scaffold64865_cov17-Prasinocladus_malaysianus.AAC.1
MGCHYHQLHRYLPCISASGNKNGALCIITSLGCFQQGPSWLNTTAPLRRFYLPFASVTLHTSTANTVQTVLSLFSPLPRASISACCITKDRQPSIRYRHCTDPSRETITPTLSEASDNIIIG